MFDISSVKQYATPNCSGPSDPLGNTLQSLWRGDCYDAVGFSQALSSIMRLPCDPGVGSGTLADPFHRSSGQRPTESTFQWTDTFVFSSLSSPLTLQSSNLYSGYRFVAISGMTFQAPC